MSKNDYYLGLDCGTSSVGWAVTDEAYNLLRAKGKTMWGFNSFDEANTAAERRLARGTRRRNDRADNRLKLLRMLFEEEIAKVDKDFYRRLDESFYKLEDKRGLIDASSDTLFNDPAFKDKDFHKKYKTIWHLRNEIVHASANEHFDIRLYFLAIQHIYKHRGHFLFEGGLKGRAGDFNEIYAEFVNVAKSVGFAILDDEAEAVEKIILDKTKGKLDKKKLLKERLEDIDSEDTPTGDVLSLSGLIVGSSVELGKLFGLEADNKCNFSFDTMVLEEKQNEIESFLMGDSKFMEVIFAAKRIYDYAILNRILGSSDNISEAMVEKYDQHKKDLKKIKELLKPFPKVYKEIFKNEQADEKHLNYNAYIGKAYGKIEKSGRKKSFLVNQTDFNKFLKKKFEELKIDLSKDTEFVKRLGDGEVLPKQRGQAKGTIPQQLHHNELELIVNKLVEDYPSFGKKVKSENEKYNTKAKKLLYIHSFRRPYYCGPLVTKNKSQFSWADEEIKQIVYPWNFYDEGLVNLEERANEFITRMTNECSYLRGEKVLPKASLLYQKYMVLNEINNLKINNKRINDQKKKQEIYGLFERGEIKGNITLRRLEKELKARKIIDDEDELSGSAEHKSLPKMSTHQEFKDILGEDYYRKYKSEQLEEVIKAITILGNEKKMLKNKIQKILKCDEDVAASLSKRNYKDWGRFSAKFLIGIKAPIGTRQMSILEALEYTCNNLMELLGGEYSFKDAMEAYNKIDIPEDTELKYAAVDKLYCSPAVKRSVWQAAKIVSEITKIMGKAPAKIFIESTRGEDANEKRSKENGVALARKRRMEEAYKAINNVEAKTLLKELDGHEDRDFQNKKLFLYYQQMGKCAYCGEHINLEDLKTNVYDIDHIYPRSLTMDDSLEKNKVLVHAEHNRIKSNIYPLDEQTREAMSGIWRSWRSAELISEEKYNRLTRVTPLSDDELGGFVARQLVETSQTVKAIRDLFQQYYSKTKIVLVKAGQVSGLRKLYGYPIKDSEGKTISEGHPEFIKLRALNDMHHAKDAYLNIVVGDTMSQTFTNDPVKWIKENHPGDQKNYSINPKILFRREEWYYSKKCDKDINWPEMKGWKYGESFDIVSRTLKRNDVLWTKMPYEFHGMLSKQTILGASTDNSALMPIKSNGRLTNVNKYGGYDKVAGAYFAVVEISDTKKGNRRKIIQIPLTQKDNAEKYIKDKYNDAKIIMPKILIGSRMKVDGLFLTIMGRSGDSIVYHPAMQNKIDVNLAAYIKKVTVAYEKIMKMRNKKSEYELDERDGITLEDNIKLMKELCDKNMKLYGEAPRADLRKKISGAGSSAVFKDLSLQDQCVAIMGMLKLLSCNADSGEKELLLLGERTGGLSQLMLSNDISDVEIEWIKQSVTGLMEKKINLNEI